MVDEHMESPESITKQLDRIKRACGGTWTVAEEKLHTAVLSLTVFASEQQKDVIHLREQIVEIRKRLGM